MHEQEEEEEEEEEEKRWEKVGVCDAQLQILTLFQAKKCHYQSPIFRLDV